MKLVPKIIIFVSLVVLITMTVIGSVAYIRTHEVILNQVKHIQKAEVDTVHHRLSEQIQSIERTAEIVSKNRAIRRALDTGNSRGINQLLNEIVEIYSFFRYAMVVDANQTVFAVSTRDSTGQSARREHLLGRKIDFPWILTNNSLLNTTDLAPYSASPEVDLNDEDHAVENARTQWFYAPIKLGANIVGWIILSYDWEHEVTDFLNLTKETMINSETPIIDLTLFDQSSIWASTGSTIGPQKFSTDWLMTERSIVFGSQHLQLAVISDKQLALAEIDKEGEFILYLTLASAFILISVLALILKKNLVDRIEILAKGQAQLTTGKLQTRLPDLGRDEIGDLSRSFNDLSDWLGRATVSTDYVNDIINSTADGLITATADNKIEMFNPAAEAAFGYEAWEVYGKDINILIRQEKPSKQHESSDFLTNAILKKSHVVLGIKKENGTFPMELNVSKLSSGGNSQFVAIFRDISYRRAEEAENTRILSLLEATLEATDNGILVADLEANTLRHNSHFQKMWNIPDDILVKKNAPELRVFVKNQLVDPESFIQGVADILERPYDNYSDMIELADGRFFERVSRPMYIGNTPAGRVWSFRDVTQRRTDEIALKKLADEQGILRQDAEKGERSKSEFLATMSHEIRTPISGILGMAEALLEESLSSENYRRVQIVYDSGNALMRILNDILDFSKLEAGKFEIEEIDFSIKREVEQVLEIMMPRVDEKSLYLTQNIADDLPVAINSDPTRFRQLLYNLIGNAIKFTDNGGVSIQISTGVQKNEIYVGVTDTGLGIKKEVQGNLFQRFQQADSTTARKFGGSGLGLAICRSLVEAMGGEIGLESEINVGSTFWFTLIYNSASESFSEPAKEKRFEKFKSTRSLHILIVEDSFIIQKVLGEIFKPLGHTISIANDGREALEKIEESSFDVVIMDRRMPVMDGMEATKTLRKTGYADLPIIGCTADAMVQHRQEFLDSGVNKCISKPINKAELLEAINSALNEQIHVTTESTPLASATELNAPNNASISPEINLSKIEELSILQETLDRDTLVILLQEFVSATPVQLTELQDAFEKKNTEVVSGIAHAIKGNASTFGFKDIMTFSKKIENNDFQTTPFEELIPDLESLASSFELVRTEIERHYLGS